VNPWTPTHPCAWGHHVEDCACLHWVYVMSNAAGAVLYIGATSKPQVRLESHYRKPWFSTVVSVRWIPVAGKRAAMALERRLTDEHRPLHDRSWVVRNPLGAGARAAA